MKTTFSIIGFIAIAAIGGYVAYQQSMQSTTSNIDASTSMQSEEGVFEGSLADLSKRGGTWECAVQSSANTGAGTVTTQGTVFVHGEKVRANFTSDVPGFGSVTAFMVADGTDVYSWTSAMPQGVVTTMADTQKIDADVSTNGSGYDANQSYTYDCVKAQADEELFVVPTDITFTRI